MKDCSNCAHGGILKMEVAHCELEHATVMLPHHCDKWEDATKKQTLSAIEREEHHPYPEE